MFCRGLRAEIKEAAARRGRARGRGLGCVAQWAERAGDFVKPWMALDGFGQVFHAEVNGAQGDAVALGVCAEPVQCARLTALAVLPDGQPKVVQFPVLLGDHRKDGVDSVTAGGVFVGSNLAKVGGVTLSLTGFL